MATSFDGLNITDVRFGTIPADRLYKGNTLIWERNKRLPSEYQEVEYIQSSGTQYINTQYYANGNSSYVLQYSDFKVKGVVFGAYNGSWATGSGLYINTADSDGGNPFLHYYANARVRVGFHSEGVIEINKGAFYLDGTQYLNLDTKTFNINYPTYIFGANWRRQSDHYASYRLHYLKIYDNDTLVRDFVPCYRKADFKAGMYDLVNNVFYTNAGTGEFTLGGIV